MTLDEVKAQFTGLMNRRDLTANTGLVSTFINQAIMRIQRDLRIPAMEKSVLVTIANPYNGLVIPNDFIELINIIPQNSTNMQRLSRVDITKAVNLAMNVDLPQVYARQGGLWILGPSPALADVIRVDYYAEFAPLVNGTDTNILSIIGWDLIVYAALVAACEYYKDSRISAFEARFQQIFASLQGQGDDDELDGLTQVQATYAYPDDMYAGDDCWGV